VATIRVTKIKMMTTFVSSRGAAHVMPRIYMIMREKVKRLGREVPCRPSAIMGHI